MTVLPLFSLLSVESIWAPRSLGTGCLRGCGGGGDALSLSTERGIPELADSTDPLARCLMWRFVERLRGTFGGGDGLGADWLGESPPGPVGEYGGGFMRPRGGTGGGWEDMRSASASATFDEPGAGRVGEAKNGLIMSAASEIGGENGTVVTVDVGEIGCKLVAENPWDDPYAETG